MFIFYSLHLCYVELLNLRLLYGRFSLVGLEVPEDFTKISRESMAVPPKLIPQFWRIIEANKIEKLKTAFRQLSAMISLSPEEADQKGTHPCDPPSKLFLAVYSVHVGYYCIAI